MYPPTVKRLINNCHTDYYRYDYYVYNKVAYCNLSRILFRKTGAAFYFARQAQSVKWSLINPEACKWA